MSDGSVSKNPAQVTAKVLLLAVVLAITAAVGLIGESQLGLSRGNVWLGILVLMLVFALLVSKFITGMFRGILIDARNKMSLSRMQMFSWTLLVLSTVLAGVLTNVGATEIPFSITIPPELWIVMGISTASLVAAPAVLGSKQAQKADSKQVKKVAAEIKAEQDVEVDEDNPNVIVRNKSKTSARWADLMKGEEVTNATTVDLGKMQMFFFTFILAVGYGASIYSMFGAEGAVTALPPVGQGMTTLLGISHTGYLANKTVRQPAAESKTSDAGDAGAGKAAVAAAAGTQGTGATAPGAGNQGQNG